MTFFHAQAPIAAPTLCATHGCKRSRRRGTYLSTFVVCNAASSALAAGLPGAAKDVLPEDVQVSKAAAAIINYALEFARVSETYEVTSWSLLLGILRFEHSTAAKALQALGLTDLYGAWHEVLWALHSVNALEPRAFVPEIGFADRAYHVLLGACNFAAWGGRTKVQSEDLLLALAAGGVLDGLFPDLKLSFTRVRAAVEKTAGGVYVLPDDKDRPPGSKQEEEDVDFL